MDGHLGDEAVAHRRLAFAAQAVEIAKDLIASADILVENFSSGVMEKFGLGYEAVSAINPRLIYCSISAYGREGELASRAGFDPMIQVIHESDVVRAIRAGRRATIDRRLNH
jgi:hypothetical protein